MAIDDSTPDPINENPYATPGGDSGVSTLSKSNRFLKLWIPLGLLLMFLGIFTLRPIRFSGEPARRTQCKVNLKQIGFALAQYHQVWNSFPPAFTVGVDGKPLHSWRTLILPYMGGDVVYDKLDLTKPWDDPVNQEAWNAYRSQYRCSSSKKDWRLTTYLAVVGDDSCFPPGRTIAKQDITDDTSKTIMIVEAPVDMAVPWMSPRDLSVDQFLSINSNTKFNHVGGSHSLMADGKVLFIVSDLPQTTQQALITRSAGEEVGAF